MCDAASILRCRVDAIRLEARRHMRLALIVFASSLACNGQQFPGTAVTNIAPPPIPGVGHDYITMLDETVSPGSGGVNLRINIPMPAGRGLSFPFSVNYNSNQTLVLQNSVNGGVTWLPQAVGVIAFGGWSFPFPRLSSFVSSYTLPEPLWYPVNGGDGSRFCHMVSGFSFTDLNGVSHSLGSMAYIYDNLALNTTGTTNTDLDLACRDASFAGSNTLPNGPTVTGGDPMYQAALTQLPPDNTVVPAYTDPFPDPVPQGGIPVVTGADGTVYTFGNIPFCDPSTNGTYPQCSLALPSSIEDRNGNILRFNGNGVVDTAGRNVLTINPMNTYTPSGNQTITTADGQTYTLTWSSVGYSGYSVGAYGLSNNYPCTTSHFSVGIDPTQFNSNTHLITQQMITRITLPNGKYYGLTYDPVYGMLQQITYPDGAYTTYSYAVEPDYGSIVESMGGGYTCGINVERVMVASRVVGIIDSGGNPHPIQTQSFSYRDTSNGVAPQTTVATTDNIRNTTTYTIYNYAEAIVSQLGAFSGGMGYTASPLEASIVYEDSNHAPLKTVAKSWYDQYLIACEVETIPTSISRGTLYGYSQGGVLTHKGEWDYGQISPSACGSTNNIGYGATPPSGRPTRETLATIQGFGTTNYSVGPSLFDRPCKVVVNDSAGNPASETDLYYDGETGLCGTPGVQSTVPVSNLPPNTHDESLYGSSSQTSRGNITRATKKCFVQTSPTSPTPPACTDSTNQYAYDETGEVTKVTDARNDNVTLISHTDSPMGAVNTNAYVTRIDPRDINLGLINGVSHATDFSYNYLAGTVASVTDPNNKINNQKTTYVYDSYFDRLTQVIYPDGGETDYCYNDVGGSLPVVSCSASSSGFKVFSGTKTGSGSPIQSYTSYDSLGRAVQTGLTSAPEGTIITDTSYDGLGQIKSTSNPYVGTSTTGSVSYVYDALGRKISETEQDGNLRSWCYDGKANVAWSNCPGTSFSNATWVNSQDESGHIAQNASDGFGRLVAVMEQLPTGTTLGLETDYTYNTLGGLTYVNQKGVTGETARTRSSTYDSLSRLVQSYNPETGWVCYGTTGNAQANGLNCTPGYDANGNLQFKTDARGITTSFNNYDPLNRLTSKSYSDGTPSSCYTYDGATVTNGIGRLASEWTQPGSCSPTSGYKSKRTFLAYDPMGRVQNEQQCVLSNCTTGTSTPPCQVGTMSAYSTVPGISYCYNLAGNPNFVTNGLSSSYYPGGISSLTFTNLYDAAGRLSSLTSNWNDATHPPNLFTATGYAPSGQIKAFSLGNHIGVTKAYDNRLRPAGETAASQ